MNRIKNLALSAIVCAGLVGSGTMAVARDSSALELAKQLNEAFVEVADKVSPSVVVITVTQKANYHSSDSYDEDGSSPWDMIPPELRKYFEEWGNKNKRNNGNNGRRQRAPEMQGEGSGIIITDDGYILTNNHVVEGADKIKVRFKSGDEYDATVKGTDPESDVAVIKVNAKGLIPAKLGDSDKTRVGEFAIAIGAPFQLTYSVTVGHVSAKGRSARMPGQGYADQDFIQTDASINPGNSGGPLVNLYGEVIGINAMIRGMNTGIGFAIPVNLAKRVKDHLIAEGKFTRSYIGVYIDDIKDDPNYRELDKSLRPDVKDGVVISAIQPDGPAAKSDLKAGDIVVSVDGKTVGTPRQLQEEVALKKPGSMVTLEVVRGSKHVPIKVKTQALPGQTARANNSHNGNGETEPAKFGMTVHSINKDLAAKFDIDPNQQGVVVTTVEADSIAEEKGLKPGDIITDVNHKPVSNMHDFASATQGLDAKRGAVFNVISGGTSKFLVLKETE